MNNKYMIDTDDFFNEIKNLIIDFRNSKFIDIILFCRQLARFISLALITKYEYFLGRILTEIIYLDDRFDRYDEDEAYQTIKIICMNQFIDLLPRVINNLSDEKILNELRIFLDADFEKIEKLYEEFYSKDSVICKSSIEDREDQTTGVQSNFLERFKLNLVNL